MTGPAREAVSPWLGVWEGDTASCSTPHAQNTGVLLAGHMNARFHAIRFWRFITEASVRSDEHAERVMNKFLIERQGYCFLDIVAHVVDCCL